MCFDYNTIHYYSEQNKEGNEQLLEDRSFCKMQGTVKLYLTQKVSAFCQIIF